MSDQDRLVLIEQLFEEDERNLLWTSEGADAKNLYQCLSQSPSQLDSDDDAKFNVAVCPDGACFSEQDLAGGFVRVCGVLLPCQSGSTPASSSLVMVSSTVRNLRSLALAVTSGAGVLLEGVVGSGKTSLVEHLAAVTSRSGATELIRVQLGDQMGDQLSH